MLAFLSITGIFLSVLLLFYNVRKNPSTIYLALFFLTISIYSFIQYVILYSKSELLISIFFLNAGFLTYLIGPSLYLYTRSILTDDSRFKKSDLWHFLPMIIYFVASLPHLFSPWLHKMEIASKIIENGNYIPIYNQTLFYEMIPSFVIFLSRPVLILIYTLGSVLLFVRHLKHKNESRILSHQAFMTKWVAVLFVFLVMLIISHSTQIIIAKTFQNLIVFHTLNVLQLLSGIGLIGLLVSPFFFPAILYGLPRMPEPVLLKTTGQKESTPTETKNQPSEFEQDYLHIIKQKVEIAMTDLQPYLQPNCNLAYFAKLVKIPAHHLAYYFREERKQAFNDYRNEWRVNHAKKLIAEGKTSEFTLEAIGLISGFSSRNPFFTAFKKVEEITPSAFVAQFIK